MKRLSLKNLQRQAAQASAFYNKSDISAEDFFRYKTSPFLAKSLFGFECSNSLFSKISEDIKIVENETPITVAINVEDQIKCINKKIEEITYITYTIIGLVAFALLFFVSIGFVIIIFIYLALISTVLIGSSRIPEYEKLVSYLNKDFKIYKTSLEYWNNLSWQNFERETTKKLQGLGYNAINTKLSGDEGVDIEIINNHKKFVIQCKAMKSKIGPAFIRDFVGTIGIQGASGGMIVSLNGFSNGALEATNYNNLYLFSTKEFILLEKEQLTKIIGW